MLVGTRAGVQAFADDGPVQAIFPLPDASPADGVCLGGPEMCTLFACGGGKVWKRAVNLHAAGAFSPWTKVHASPL